MLVESLCAVLMALKISSAEAETEMPVKHIIFSLMRNSADSGEELWPLIFQTELRVLPLINFRVAQPTAMDLVGRLALDVALAAPETNVAGGMWAGLANVKVAAYTRAERDGRVPVVELRPRFMVFSRFLVELAMLHREEDVYRLARRAPLVLALAAVHVALDSFGGCPPESCWRVVFSAKRLLAEIEVEQLAECVPFLRELWSATSPSDAVVQKWLKRQNTGDQVLPQAPADTEDEMLPQPSADTLAPQLSGTARTPPRRTGRATQLLSPSKKVRGAAKAATASQVELACQIPLPLPSLGEASATNVISSKTSAPAVTVAPTTPPTKSSFAARKEPRSFASTAVCKRYIEAYEARSIWYKEIAGSLADPAMVASRRTATSYLAALKGKQRLPRQKLESDSFEMERQLKRCRTHEHDDNQSMLKSKKSLLSRCGKPELEALFEAGRRQEPLANPRAQDTPEFSHI